MKIKIEGKEVTFTDGEGTVIYMTTEQLLEMVHTLNASTNEDGGLIFNLLEFTV